MTMRKTLARLIGSVLLSFSLSALVSAQSLIEATRQGKPDEVRALLSGGTDVNAAAGDGMTALHWAVQMGRVDLATMLTEAGASLTATTRIGGYTPLLMASRLGSSEMVTMLLEHGADANLANANGTTPLMFAAAAGDPNAVRALAASGADVNAAERVRGQTALMFAAAKGRADAVRALLAQGAKVDVTSRPIDLGPMLDLERDRRRREAEWDRITDEPLRQSGSRWGSSELYALELPPDDQYVDPVAGIEREYTFTELVGGWGGLAPLHFAARQGELETVKALLEGAADINLPSVGNQTSPLLIATLNGHFDVARFLLERGADPNLAQDNGVTPLFAVLDVQWASKAFYPQPRAHEQQHTTYLDLMALLLEKGADINARTNRKVWTSGYGTDRSSTDNGGATPFWRATYASDVKAMKFLIAHGADPSIPTMRPFGHPKVRGVPEDLELADVSGAAPIPYGGPGVPPLLATSGLGYADGYAANAHRYAPTGMLAAVKYLVEELHVDVNATDFEGNTALHNAASRGDNEMIEYLISKGADPHAVNRSGQTTVDVANGPVQRTQPYPDTIRLLEGMGVKNNHKCRSC